MLDAGPTLTARVKAMKKQRPPKHPLWERRESR